MPTLEERETENPEETKTRLRLKAKELGITYSFSKYIEMMEKYLLALERRVQRLERNHDLDSNEIPTAEELMIKKIKN